MTAKATYKTRDIARAVNMSPNSVRNHLKRHKASRSSPSGDYRLNLEQYERMVEYLKGFCEVYPNQHRAGYREANAKRGIDETS